MVSKPVTTSDLLALELKIGEEQRKIRHESNNRVQSDYDAIDKKISEYNTDLKLTQLTLKNMLEQMEKGFEEVKAEIRSMKSEFVTKGELEPIKEKQKNHDEIISRVVWGIVITFLSLIAGLVGLSKYM